MLWISSQARNSSSFFLWLLHIPMLFSIWQRMFNNKGLLIYLFLTNEGVRIKQSNGIKNKNIFCIALLTTVSTAYREELHKLMHRFLISNIFIIKVSNLDQFFLLCLDRVSDVQVHLYLIPCNSFQFQPLSFAANITTSDYFSMWFWPEPLATSVQFEFWGLAKLLSKPKMKCKFEVMENSTNGTSQNKVTQAFT